MANVTATLAQPTTGQILVATWAALANGDVGITVDYPRWADRNVQVFGTFGSGGSIKIEGSNNGSNWVTLTDMAGSTCVFTAAGVKMIQENVMWVRPSVTAGDGTTALTAVLVARRTA